MPILTVPRLVTILFFTAALVIAQTVVLIPYSIDVTTVASASDHLGAVARRHGGETWASP